MSKTRSDKKMRAPNLKSLISAPWDQAPDNSYYGDPRYVDKEQHGLEHLDRGHNDDEGVEQVVILGYN